MLDVSAFLFKDRDMRKREKKDKKIKEHNAMLLRFAGYTSMNVMGTLATSCYILADTFFISMGLGTEGLAALNLAIPVFGFITGCGLMMGMGGATKYSIAEGRGEQEEKKTVFTNTLIMAAVAAFVFLAAGIFFSGELASLLGADEETFDMTHIYVKTILMFAPIFILNYVMQCFVRNDGNPKISMIAMVSGSLSNILLDYVFIFPLKMGIFGAAIATCFSPVISLCILSSHLLSRKSELRLCGIKINPAGIKSTLSLGFPSLVTELSSGVVIIVYNMIIMKISGNVGVAAYGVIANLSLVVVSIYSGIAQGSQPLLSAACGQGDFEGMKKFFKYAVVLMGTLSLLIYSAIFIFAEPVAAIFNSEKNIELQAIAVPGLRIYFTAVMFVGFNIIISVYFTSMEKGLPAQIISLTRGLVLIIPAAFLLSEMLGMIGVWLSFPITEGAVSAGALIFKMKARL